MAEGLLCAGLALLLAFLFADITKKPSDPVESPSPRSESVPLPPLEAARVLFDVESFGGLVVTTNSSNPFHTGYFVPAPAPDPRPSTTKSVSIAYLGFFETEAGSRKAYVSVDGQTVSLMPGGIVAGKLSVDRIGKTEIVLLGGTLTTNTVGFRQELQIEIPVD